MTDRIANPGMHYIWTAEGVARWYAFPGKINPVLVKPREFEEAEALGARRLAIAEPTAHELSAALIKLAHRCDGLVILPKHDTDTGAPIENAASVVLGQEVGWDDDIYGDAAELARCLLEIASD